MASNDLVVRISAKNAASPVVQRLVRDLQGAGAKIKGAERNFAGLNRETKNLRDFSRGVAVPRLVQGIKGLGNEANSAFRNVGKLGVVIRALGGVEGLGLGGLIGGSIIVAKHWATIGQNTSISAKNIGMTVGQLRRYQDVGRLLNIAPAAMTSGLQGFATGLANARINKDPQFMQSLNLLGINPGTKAHPVPVAKLFPEVLAALGRIKSGPMLLQALGNLHLGANMAPLIRMGPQWLKQELAYFRAQGDTTSLFAGASKLNRDFAKLDIQTDILTNKFGKSLAPTVDDLVKSLIRLEKWVGFVASGSKRHVKPIPGAHRPIDVNQSWLGGGSGHGALRDNNPLGLKYVKGQPWVVGKDVTKNGTFGVYPNLTSGIAGAARQLNLYRARGLNTIAGIVGKWAAGDPRRFAEEAYVANRLQISPYAKLPNTPAMNEKLIAAIGRWEWGRELPMADVRRGYAQSRVTVDINHNGAPAGTSARASVSGDGSATLGTIRIKRAADGEALP